MSKPRTRTSTAPTKPEAASYPVLQIDGHFPEAIDLRPYTPDLGDTYEHRMAAALAACFTRRGQAPVTDTAEVKNDVYSIDSIEQLRPAFAAGYVVRIGDHFLVAYGLDGFVTTNGAVESIDLKDVQVWAVQRV